MSSVPTDRVYLTRRAASEYLTERGLKIKPETLARWTSTGRYNLPLIKIGRIIRYDRADLDTLIERHRVTPGAMGAGHDR